MALLQWRRFNFFEKEVLNLKDPEVNEVLQQLKEVNITACTSGRGQIIIGDGSGTIHFLDRNFQMTFFQAYEICVTHLYQLKQHNILVSVGEDEVGINPHIKVWNLDKTDKMGHPMCFRVLRAIPGTKPVPVSCLAVLENLTQIAVGFADGSVMIYKGDITRDRHSKQRVIHQDKHPVTGLAYKHSGGSTILFIVTTETTLSYNTTSKDHREILDVHGCNLHCSVISDATQENQFIVARNEALYFYQPDGRGPCLAFEGDKQMIAWYRGYLVVVSRDNKQIQRPSVESSQVRERNLVTVYDIQNKVIAFTGTFPGVVDVLSEWGSLYVLSRDNTLCQLEEKDTQTKLEILFKKNLYAMAISLAKNQQYSDGLVDIFTQYGDHLYSKGDHDGAIKQYIKTIGHLEPSYVIRKFLDAQRIHNLTAYLQALHEQGLANADHTTLLLNCYTKLKDVSKLDEFIMTDKDLNFDIETAIKVCRQAGYFKHAVYLAEKFDQYDWYLKIQLEDLQDYEKALDYISKLDFYEAERNMKNYGKSLVNAVPEKATELLKVLCTDYRPNGSSIKDAPVDSQRTILKARPEEFIHIFVHKKRKLIQFLEHMIHVQHNAANLLYNTLLELYLSDAAKEKDIVSQAAHEHKALELLKNLEAQYDIDHAMVLAQSHRFKEGILYLYEKAKLYQQILHFHMEHNEYANIMDTCTKYGGLDPSLWVQALTYFARKETDCKAQITEVLRHINRDNLMSPLLVLQTLAHNSTATLAVVKDYVIQRLQMEDELIAQDERLIRQYREQTLKMRKEIKDLKTSARIFQGAKCSMCTRPLDLPAVHFLCQHSFHQLCFEGYAENENECPICAPENRKVLDIIRSQEQTKDLHEQFHRQLDHSSDGFLVVADFFGRGVFKKVTLLTDKPSFSKESTHAEVATLEQQREKLLQKPISTNPFDNPVSRNPASSNPFLEPEDSKNPFYEPSASKNPFY